MDDDQVDLLKTKIKMLKSRLTQMKSKTVKTDKDIKKEEIFEANIEHFTNELKNKSEFSNLSDLHISPGSIENNEMIDFSLLGNCDYIITPHQSTFSFMSYYLSKKKIEMYSRMNLYGGLPTNM